MYVRSVIAASALVLALGVGTASADDTAKKTTAAPQSILANVAPMTATELKSVRGTWHPAGDRIPDHATNGILIAVAHGANGPPNRPFPQQP